MMAHVSLRRLLKGSPITKPALDDDGDIRILNGSDAFQTVCVRCGVIPVGPRRATLAAAAYDRLKHVHSA